MTDVAATELIAEWIEDREQGRDEVAAVSDLLRGRNKWSIDMRGRERVVQGSAESGAWERHAVDARGAASEDAHTHTHKHTHTHSHTHTHTHTHTHSGGSVQRVTVSVD